MISRSIAAAALIAGLGLWAEGARAHTPLFSCYDNGDGSILCEGGFSDGSSAAGVKMAVVAGGAPVVTGAMNKNSEFSFKKPAGAFTVIFDAGPGHQLEIASDAIE